MADYLSRINFRVTKKTTVSQIFGTSRHQKIPRFDISRIAAESFVSFSFAFVGKCFSLFNANSDTLAYQFLVKRR